MHGCGLNAFFTTKRLGGDVKGISAYTGIDISNIYLPIQRTWISFYSSGVKQLGDMKYWGGLH